MPQPINDDTFRENSIPVCDQCLEKAGINYCHKCGCALCGDCLKNHPCQKDGKLSN